MAFLHLGSNADSIHPHKKVRSRFPGVPSQSTLSKRKGQILRRNGLNIVQSMAFIFPGIGQTNTSCALAASNSGKLCSHLNMPHIMPLLTETNITNSLPIVDSRLQTDTMSPMGRLWSLQTTLGRFISHLDCLEVGNSKREVIRTLRGTSPSENLNPNRGAKPFWRMLSRSVFGDGSPLPASI
jgi:hypothetical protein